MCWKFMLIYAHAFLIHHIKIFYVVTHDVLGIKKILHYKQNGTCHLNCFN